MVTLLKMPRRWEDGSYNFGFGGKSTDTKPTKTWDDNVIGNGSSFFEIDTLALYFYDKDTDTWIKAKVEAGGHAITSDNITADATVDDTSGTPSVKVTKSADGNDIKFSFAFSGLKGAQGERGEKGKTDASVSLDDIGYKASVDDTTGTPAVKVSTESTDAGTVVNFAFTGLKGEKGDKGDPGSGGSAASTDKGLEVGYDNTVSSGGLAVGSNNSVQIGGLAVGGNNKVGMLGAAIGTGNTAVDHSLAVGQNVASNQNQIAVGTNFKGVTQDQKISGFKTPAFTFIAASNDDVSTRFDFAVPNTTSGGLIIRGRNGASDAYYWLKIANGAISIIDITNNLMMS